MDAPPPDDFDPYRDDDAMKLIEGRDPIALIGIALAIVVNIAGLSYIGGKFDHRMTTAERDIAELKAKGTKDAAQDIQIAVISTQLTLINSGVSEIKASLEGRK
jgi:hypothetical protein